MSSVCACEYDDYGPEIYKVRGPHTARKISVDRRTGEVRACPNCGIVVQIGERCVDWVGVFEGDGFLYRFHAECFRLMELFGEKLCDGGWKFPFDLDEAAEHAMANGDDPFWRDWLLLYEQTWAWRIDEEVGT